jgi:hypothetical protein
VEGEDPEFVLYIQNLAAEVERKVAAPARGSLLILLAILLTACADPYAARTGSAQQPRYRARIERTVEVHPLYRQGLARVEGGWIYSFNDGLFRTDDRDVQIAALQPAIPQEWKARGYNHIGDIDVVGDVLYAPLEQPDYEKGRQAVLLYSASALAYLRGFEVDQHENSFLTVDPENGIAYSLDRFGGDALLRYDVARGWKPLEPLRMSKFVAKVQGADLAEGAIWLVSDDETKGLHRVDLSTGHVADLGSIGYLDGEAEGIDASREGLRLLRVLSIDAARVPVRAMNVDVTFERH